MQPPPPPSGPWSAPAPRPSPDAAFILLLVGGLWMILAGGILMGSGTSCISNGPGPAEGCPSIVAAGALVGFLGVAVSLLSVIASRHRPVPRRIGGTVLVLLLIVAFAVWTVSGPAGVFAIGAVGGIGILLAVTGAVIAVTTPRVVGAPLGVFPFPPPPPS